MSYFKQPTDTYLYYFLNNKWTQEVESFLSLLLAKFHF